jgi:ribose 1,5-bisphosphokinase PhnN
MKTIGNIDAPGNSIPAEVMADAQLVAVCVSAGRPIPAEVAQRVREEAQKITERLRRQYGTLDIGVPAIRELRGELPE